MSLLSDYEAWKAKLINDVDQVLLTHVAPAVKDEMQTQIYDKVYAAYDPTQYERRYDNGGLADKSNMQESVEAGLMTLHVVNLTTGNEEYADSEEWDPGLITDIIEKGVGYHWRHSRIYSQQPYPRPFINETEKEVIRDGTVDRELANGLNALGYTVIQH